MVAGAAGFGRGVPINPIPAGVRIPSAAVVAGIEILCEAVGVDDAVRATPVEVVAPLATAVVLGETPMVGLVTGLGIAAAAVLPTLEPEVVADEPAPTAGCVLDAVG